MAGWKVVSFRLLPLKSSVKLCLLLRYFNKMRYSYRDFKGIKRIYIGIFLLINRVKLVFIVHLYGFEETNEYFVIQMYVKALGIQVMLDSNCSVRVGRLKSCL